jgi:hypothetical protein
MKLQGSSLVLLVTAIGLVSTVYIMESLPPNTQSVQPVSVKPLFPFQESDVQAFTLETPQQTLMFQKTGQGNSASWKMLAPHSGPAEEGTIAFLLNLMTTGKSQQTFQSPKSRQAEFGFDRPLATIKAKLANQQTATLVLGKPTFDQGSLYALVNPAESPNQELTVQLVSTNFANAVTRPFSEWQKEPSPKKK